MDPDPAHSLFRVYPTDELRYDGYPHEWKVVRAIVRAEAGSRCVRCGHPYRVGEHRMEETEAGWVSWSPCDEVCFANGRHPFGAPHTRTRYLYDGESGEAGEVVEASWRILTVHHLNGDKPDLRWWNLASLCQRCHLTIQGKVLMERPWPYPHSEWFKPYAAGWYAEHYLGEALTRDEVAARLEELLDLERWPSLF